MKSFFIQIKGVVQGVGFRPFVYTLALKYDIKGWVNNDEKGVNILLYACEENIRKFINPVAVETKNDAVVMTKDK